MATTSDDDIRLMDEAIELLNKARAKLKELYKVLKVKPSIKNKIQELQTAAANLRREIRESIRDVPEEQIYSGISSLFKEEPIITPPFTYSEDKSINLREAITKYIIDMSNTTHNYYQDVNKLRNPLISIFNKVYSTYGPFKFIWIFKFLSIYPQKEGDVHTIVEYNNANKPPIIVYNENDIYNAVNEVINDMHDIYISSLEDKESGYTYNEPIQFSIYFYKYEALAGSGYIEIPKWVKNSKSCINIIY